MFWDVWLNRTDEKCVQAIGRCKSKKYLQALCVSGLERYDAKDAETQKLLKHNQV